MKTLFLLITVFIMGKSALCAEISYDDKILCHTKGETLEREISLFLSKVGHPMSGFNHQGIAVLKTDSTMAAFPVEWKYLDHKPIEGTITDENTSLRGWTIEMKPVQGEWSKDDKKDFKVTESPPTCGPVPCSPIPPRVYTVNCQILNQ